MMRKVKTLSWSENWIVRLQHSLEKMVWENRPSLPCPIHLKSKKWQSPSILMSEEGEKLGTNWKRQSCEWVNDEVGWNPFIQGPTRGCRCDICTQGTPGQSSSSPTLMGALSVLSGQTFQDEKGQKKWTNKVVLGAVKVDDRVLIGCKSGGEEKKRLSCEFSRAAEFKIMNTLPISLKWKGGDIGIL